MKIVLVRHTSVGVRKGTCYGWSDVPLAESFPEEAQRTYETLRALVGKDENASTLNNCFDAVYCSPLLRARKLAAHCGFIYPKFDDRLKEFNMGDWEMKSYDHLWISDPYFKLWSEDYLHLPTPHGESFPEFYKRVTCFLSELTKYGYERVIVFAHGGVLLCAGIYAGLFDVEHAYGSDGHLVDYGGIEVIQI
ncbi:MULTISPECIES: alpha-ribazole phosphatase family protein [Segatella]|jgi:alpha-ribazole phosphatase|uniref:Phosphoglycerate mutase n=2 Tax=Segatella TaxID=2974251 RepID=D8DZD7_9BACT|nr:MULTISPECIES: alpha-ribazole phosphatase family protein [Segatella]MBQ3857507.1 alpha-ribazole phosphatase family protein [Prevotella sp.]EFI71207.1 phosphoglycerate mutase [Segatella baroniae B14]MDR4929893.1 alpha-ribazole phosphatase family protein [Segatella bryantii]MEE3414435.1 alpha-ribazole phosphatase family protein [Prevotella sp.]OYP57358.1 alpha-ribazole phosphatase [Segatella bryantii]